MSPSASSIGLLNPSRDVIPSLPWQPVPLVSGLDKNFQGGCREVACFAAEEGGKLFPFVLLLEGVFSAWRVQSGFFLTDEVLKKIQRSLGLSS